MQAASDPFSPALAEAASSDSETGGDGGPLPAMIAAIREDGTVDPAFRSALDLAPTLHRHMVRARVVSARMVALQRTERIGFHRSAIGEEATIVGAVLAARDVDWIFPGAREWYAALARGLPLSSYVHHAFGSAGDPAKGHASPDHVPARRFHVVPPSGVVGAHLPQAVGAAWAAKIKKEQVAAIALFGAEVAETGDFHNAMNFAGVFKAPVVFVCRAKPRSRVSERAVAYGIATARVDGSDALAVLTVVRAALARANEGKGATLIEAVSPVIPAIAALDDAALAEGDVLDLGDNTDPLSRLRRVLAREKLIELGAQESIAHDVRIELDAAIDAATQAGAPKKATIFDDVYARVPKHLAAQRDDDAKRSGAAEAFSGGVGGGAPDDDDDAAATEKNEERTKKTEG